MTNHRKAPKENFQIRVRYWRGTTQHEGIATSYLGARKIANRNQNALPPTFWLGDRQLYDDGNGLVLASDAEAGRRVYQF